MTSLKAAQYIKNAIRRILFAPKANHSSKHCFYQDDVFLAEFPKSGVTWLSTMVAYVDSFQNGRNEISFPTILSYISEEDFESTPTSQRSIYLRGRLIKTHSHWRPWHQRAIYLYRDPARVLASLYKMSIAYGWIEKDTDPLTFCLADQRGICAWKEHVNSWIWSSHASASICFVCYDDLVADTFGTLKRIYEFFDARIEDDLLHSAILMSSRAKMAESEERFTQSDIRFKVRFESDYRFVGKSLNRNDDIYARICQPVYSKLRSEILALGMKIPES